MRTQSALTMLIALGGCGAPLAPAPVDAEPVDAVRRDAFEIVTRDFSISLAPTTLTLSAPGSAVVAVTVGRAGAPSPITFTTPDLPPYVTATVTPGALGPDANTAQLTIAVSAPTTGIVHLDGTGFTQHGEAVGDATHTATLSVTAN